ncbi:hypothetical protein [Mycobacterium sp. SA01]|uniref:hypothetical protein n=1 Tax=Mycobacterium sp. SA01 TaxID=3238820 RepID=UPI00351ACC66
MKPPTFLRVVGSDVGEHGPAGALVLALVRYVLDLPGERSGRILIDGEMWWQATYTEIGAAALGGMGKYSVGRIMVALVESGALLACQPRSAAGVQTRAYRPAKCDSAPPLTSRVRNRISPDLQSAKSQRGGANSQHPGANSQQGCCDSALSSSSVEELREELDEQGEGARAPAGHVLAAPLGDITPPDLFCPKHMPEGPKGESCPGCGDQRRINDRWNYSAIGAEYRHRQAVVDKAIPQGARAEAHEAGLRRLYSDPSRARTTAQILGQLPGPPQGALPPTGADD